MYNLFHKRSPKQKAVIHENQAPQFNEHFVPLLLGGFAFFFLVSISVQPAPKVGEFLNFDGNMPPPSAGSEVVNATMVHNIWETSGPTCHMNLQTMIQSKGMTEIEAVNAKQVILQWHANKGTSSIGCPNAPALLAVNTDDYQHMVSWEKAGIKPYFRG